MSFEESKQKLVDAVDQREPETLEYGEQDWSERVEQAIETSEKAIVLQVKALGTLAPNQSEALHRRLSQYRLELDRIRAEFEASETVNIEVLLTDILDDYEKNYSTSNSESMAPVRDYALNNPAEFLAAYPDIKDSLMIEGLGEVLDQALLYDILEGDGQAAKKFLQSGILAFGQVEYKQSEIYRKYSQTFFFFLKEFPESTLVDTTLRYDRGRVIALARQNPTAFCEAYPALEKILPDDARDIAKEVLLKLIWKNPSWFFEHFPKYREQHNFIAWPAQLQILAQKHPILALKYYPEYKDKFKDAKALAYSAMDQAMEEDPGAILRAGEALGLSPAKLGEAAERAAIIDPDAVFDYEELVLSLPDNEKYFDRAEARLPLKRALWVQLPDNYPEREHDFMRDPSLVGLEDVDRHWIDPDGAMEDQTYYQFLAYVGRQLYLQGKPLNEMNVKAGYEKILSSREALGNVPLFEGRNILVLSHLEEYSNGRDRFGRKEMIAALKRQQGNPKLAFEHFESETAQKKNLKEAKRQTLEHFAEMSPPMTFVFDGHGSKDAMYLSDGQLERDNWLLSGGVRETPDTIKITVEELAKALQQRVKKYGMESIKKDILIFASCYNINFIRSLAEEAKSRGFQIPICLGASEMNMLGFSERSNEMGTKFFSEVIKLQDDRSTIGDIWKNQEDVFRLYMNPSLYVPDVEGEGILQIADSSLADGDQDSLVA